MVVVSALSSDNKAEGTTSRLLLASQLAVEQNLDYQLYLRKIEDTHLDIIYTLLKSNTIRQETRNLINKELLEISSFCDSLSVIREISPRSHDKIIGCGERMAAILTSAILNDQGLKSQYINLSNIFDNATNTKNFENILKRRLAQVFDEQNIYNTDPESQNVLNTIPVITGFLGQLQNGLVNTFIIN